MDTLYEGASFHYPKKGGLGGIWRAIAKKLPRNNVKFRAEVVQIDLENKTAKTRDDIEIKYKVSSTVLDTVVLTWPSKLPIQTRSL